MKVQQIHINKFKKLENIDAQFEGKHVLICGGNGAGKSSIMQFIEIAFGNKSHIPPHAEGSGYVITSKDGRKYKFAVQFVEGKPLVTITTPDGLETSKKGALASICGALDFDIYDFVEQSKTASGRKEQIKTFKSFLDQETQDQLKAFEDKVLVSYTERTETGRKVKELEALIKEHPLSGHELSKFPAVDMAKLNADKEAIKTRLNGEYVANKKLNDDTRKGFEAAKEAHRSEIDNFNTTQQQIQERWSTGQKALVILRESGYEGQEVALYLNNLFDSKKILISYDYDSLPQPTYITEIPSDAEIVEIDKQIANAFSTNKLHSQAQELQKYIKDLDAYREQQQDLTVRIETQRQEIEEAIKDMSNPVEGLAFNEDSLIYNGIEVNPDCLSTSEIMILGARLELVKNQELGILFIPSAESMGTEKRKELVALVDAIDGQLIMEQVVDNQEDIKFELFTKI